MASVSAYNFLSFGFYGHDEEEVDIPRFDLNEANEETLWRAHTARLKRDVRARVGQQVHRLGKVGRLDVRTLANLNRGNST